MICKICYKNIDSICWITKKPYCSKECEKRDNYFEKDDVHFTNEETDALRRIFGMK